MKNVLVIKLRYIGDVILSTPMLRGLRLRYPEARLVCLVNPGTQEVLTYNPHIDEVLVIARGSLREQIQFWLELRSRRFDCVIDLTDGDRSAFLSWFTGASVRIGFNLENRWRGVLYSDCVDSKDHRASHVVDRHAEVMKVLGGSPLFSAPEVYIGEQHTEVAKVTLQQLGLTRRRWIIVHPAARYWFKAWPTERFAALCDQLMAQDLSVLLVGDTQDGEIAEKIQAAANVPLLSLVGKTELLELAALLKYADVFVGNDTGVMHLAAAVGCPVLGLFGPTNPMVWGPRGKKTKVIYKGLDCRACFHPGCLRGEENCMRQISVDEVYSSVLQLLQDGKSAP